MTLSWMSGKFMTVNNYLVEFCFKGGIRFTLFIARNVLTMDTIDVSGIVFFKNFFSDTINFACAYSVIYVATIAEQLVYLLALIIPVVHNTCRNLMDSIIRKII